MRVFVRVGAAEMVQPHFTGFTYVFGESSKTRDRQGQLGRVGVSSDDTHYLPLQASVEGEGGGRMRLPKSANSAGEGVGVSVWWRGGG